MPKPELYVVYTGDRKDIPNMISLTDAFFDGEAAAVDVKVKVICESDTDGIINQYIIFCKVYNEQMKLYGLTRKTVMETIRICKDRNVLKEYLQNREKEVVSIMMSLFDEEEVMKSYIRSERYEAAQEAELDKAKKTALRMLKAAKISLEDIADYTELPVELVREMQKEVI